MWVCVNHRHLLGSYCKYSWLVHVSSRSTVHDGRISLVIISVIARGWVNPNSPCQHSFWDYTRVTKENRDQVWRVLILGILKGREVFKILLNILDWDFKKMVTVNKRFISYCNTLICSSLTPSNLNNERDL